MPEIVVTYLLLSELQFQIWTRGTYSIYKNSACDTINCHKRVRTTVHTKAKSQTSENNDTCNTLLYSSWDSWITQPGLVCSSRNKHTATHNTASVCDVLQFRHTGEYVLNLPSQPERTLHFLRFLTALCSLTCVVTDWTDLHFGEYQHVFKKCSTYQTGRQTERQIQRQRWKTARKRQSK